MFERLSSQHLIIFSAALRAFLIAYGTLQDAISSVRYTDIDYDVFTDAANFIVQGESPYDRSTYRYSPLLAYMMIPNIQLHPEFGKVLFATADIAVAVLIQQRVAKKCIAAQCQQGLTRQIVLLALSAWLFNPYTATISTRGNADCLVVLLQLAVLSLLQSSPSPSYTSNISASNANIALAGALYGLLVHWRVFPVIYGPSLVLFFWTHTPKGPRRVLTWFGQCVAFGMPALAVFSGFGALFYSLYGNSFLHETFLYHATRRDPRHNFSPHFLFTYLYHFSPRDAAGTPLRPEVPSILNPEASAPLCMVAALLASAAAFSHDLDMCWLLSTIVFVAFNKVSTAQYFVWYLGILPIVLPHLFRGWKALQWAAVSAFVCCQLLWLSQAYRLEFLGEPVFEAVWGMGLLLMSSHVFVYWALVQAYKQDGHKIKGT